MAVWAEQAQVLSQVVGSITINVIYMKDEGTATPAIFDSADGAGAWDPDLSESPPKQVWLGP